MILKEISKKTLITLNMYLYIHLKKKKNNEGSNYLKLFNLT